MRTFIIAAMAEGPGGGADMRDHPIAGPIATPEFVLDGVDWTATHHQPWSYERNPAPAPPTPVDFSAWPNLLPLDQNNFTGTLSSGLSKCELSCSSQVVHHHGNHPHPPDYSLALFLTRSHSPPPTCPLSLSPSLTPTHSHSPPSHTPTNPTHPTHAGLALRGLHTQ